MMTQSSWLLKAHQSVSLFSNSRKYIAYVVLPLLLVLSFFIHNQCQAAESSAAKSQEHSYAGIYKHKINSNFSVRGWRLTPNIYFGQTKTFGDTGYGLLVDKGEYAYGLIDQKISILKSF